MQTNESKLERTLAIKNKYNTKYITYDSIIFDNIEDINNIDNRNNVKSDKKFTFFSPLYVYNEEENICAPLVMKTLFMDFKFKGMNTNKISLVVDISDNLKYFESILHKYDNMVGNFVTSNYPDYKLCSSLVQLNNTMKFHLMARKEKLITQIIKYNINSKYTKIEHLKLNIDETKEFIKRLEKDKYKKEARIIFSIMTWISKETKMYGSKLIANYIEIKYSGSNINSIIDKSEISINTNEMLMHKDVSDIIVIDI